MGDAQAMRVYCEVLFAGFRAPRQERGEFPSAFVRDFFAQHGSVRRFVYDEMRGIGSVEFASGVVAVNCYLALHLSLLPAPGHPREGHDEALLLYLDFARICPFVDPSLMGCGEMSRELLRDRPKPADPPRRGCLAEYTVASWDCTTDEAKETQQGSGRPVVRDGPHFPCDTRKESELDLSMALWALLRPEADGPPAAGDRVTVLDLWWEFYNRYVLHKTEPEAKRIKDVYFAFSQKPSPVQEVIRLLLTATGGAHVARATRDRLARSDVYRSICGFLCHTLRLRYDPSWASLMRDVSARAGRPLHALANKNVDDEINFEAEAALLRMPLLQAAANLIENVLFLRTVRTGTVSAAGPNGSHNSKDCFPNTFAEMSDFPMNAQQTDENLYLEILHTLRGAAPSGSASEIMSMCEDPLDFRSLTGHIGWNELRGETRKRSRMWVWCQALFISAAVLLFLWAVVRMFAQRFAFNEVLSAQPPMQYMPSPDATTPPLNIRPQSDL